MEIIDLRSDTVTRPSEGMRDAMRDAVVGDDVIGDDPTVQMLEQKISSIFGKEAALFCPSGTMCNQIAINVHTQPGDEVICHEDAHVYRYEGGGMAKNSGVSAAFVRGNNGRIEPGLLEGLVNPDDSHYPRTSLVCLEDTANRGGGAYYDLADIIDINGYCRRNGLKLHLDGARVFNALTENGVDPKAYGEQFDSISVCLSKGLGAPIGSLLLGESNFIYQARRVRKVFGGGMRQSGILAAAGIYALDNNVTRLREDHIRARRLAGILREKAFVEDILPVDTNIVVIQLTDALQQMELIDELRSLGILCVPFGKGRLRFATHLDINDEHIEMVAERITTLT